MPSSFYREKILELRDAQHRKKIEENSLLITKRLLRFFPIQQAQHIFMYLHFRSEVETRHLLDIFLGMGKMVSVPLVLKKEQRLKPVRIINPAKELAPGAWGILEPLPEVCAAQHVASSSIDALLMPGSVFDLGGGRIGYGGGFYDRFVSGIPTACRIALAFDFQIVQKLSLQPHDELVDFIITEKRIVAGRQETCKLSIQSVR